MIRVALRSVRTHLGQFLLTALAVVLGVAFLSGTLALRGVLSDAFSALTSSTLTADLYVIGERAGSGDSAVRAPTNKIDASLAGPVSDVDGVAAARPSSSVNATLVGADSAPVTAMGAPSLALPLYADDRGQTLVAGSPPRGRDQIALESDALARSGLRIGQSTHIVVNGEPVEVSVVGEFTYGASMAGATIIGLDPDWLMELAAPDGKVTSIAVRLADGADAQAVRGDIAALLPGDVRLLTRAELIDEQNEYVERILGYVETLLLVFVVLAMFVGSFIIMNTFAMSVRRRQREFALLRAIGASPTSVFATVLLQALVIGILGSVLGVLAGACLIRGLVASLGAWGMPLPDGGAPMTRRIVAVSIGVGVLVTVVGALLPSRDAALTPPVEAMRDASGAKEKPLRARTGAGAVLLGPGLAGILAAWHDADLPWRGAVLGAGAGALLLGLLLVSPAVSRPVIVALGAPVRLIRPGGRLAVRLLAASPRRTAATSAALVIGMALVCAGATITASMRASVSSIVNDSMHADLYVRQATFSTRLIPIPPEMTAAIARLDGVASTTAYAANLASVTGPDGKTSTGYVVAIDPRAYAAAYDPNVTAGSLDDLDATHVAAFASSGLVLGDRVTITGPAGSVTATVSAVADTTGVVGALYVTPEVAAATGSLTTAAPTDPEQVLASPNGLFITLDEGADPGAVRASIREILAPAYVFKVFDPDELSDQVGSQADRMLAVLYGLLGLSIVIAILGIVNTLVLSVSERVREIGLMRAVGLGRAQLAGQIVCESVLTAVYGTVLGAGAGVLLAGALRALLADRGLTELVIPWARLGAVLGVSVVVGVLAALWPAARATRLPVLEAIAAE